MRDGDENHLPEGYVLERRTIRGETFWTAKRIDQVLESVMYEVPNPTGGHSFPTESAALSAVRADHDAPGQSTDRRRKVPPQLDEIDDGLYALFV